MARKKFMCPQCGVPIRANGRGSSTKCPACGFVIADVAAELGKSNASNDFGINVIKYEGDNSAFVWKHPVTDFNLGTMLVVHESQEAFFYSSGQILDTFGPGRHVLKTENIPLLKKFYRIPTGGANLFHTEIYFINRTVQMGIRWGTPDRVRFIDPATKIPLDIGASGDMNLAVSDPYVLLKNVVGTLSGLRRDDVLGTSAVKSAGRTSEQSVRYDSYGNRIEGGGYENERNEALSAENSEWSMALNGIFRSMVTTTVKTHLARIICDLNINIMEIDSYLEPLSAALGDKIRPGFEAYGLTVVQFFVTNVSLPEDDQNFKKLRELTAASYIGAKEAEVQADIVRAKREVELEKGATENEMARLAAQREVIRAQAEAEKMRLSGMAQAEVMRAQGYDKKDELQAEVQKAYAAGIGQMGSGGSGPGGAGGSMMSDMIGLGVGLSAAGKVSEQFRNMFDSNTGSGSENRSAGGWSCPSCGERDNRGAFCSGCGKPKAALWDCPSCGERDNRGAFCSGCGKPKPALWDCPSCGEKGNKGAFCSGCGKPRNGE